MKCHVCKRDIVAGIEQRKMIAVYRQPDSTETPFGFQMPAGGLEAATGQLLRAYHGKCFYNQRRRDSRPASRAPSPYEIGQLALNRDEIADLGLTDEEALRRAAAIGADRAADPGHVEPTERDWREQTVVDLDHLK